MGENENTLSERIGRLEMSATALTAENQDLRSLLRAMQGETAKGRETNWTLILGVIVALISLYAAAVRPLSMDIERQEKEAARLADAVLVKQIQIGRLETAEATIAARILDLSARVEDIYMNGSPRTDRRLAILEERASIKARP